MMQPAAEDDNWPHLS